MNIRPTLRRGSLILEAAVGITLLVATLAALTSFVASMSRQKEAVDRRERAMILAANLLERLVADPAELAPGVRAVDVAEMDGPRLVGLVATRLVADEPLDADDPASPRWRSVRLLLRWPGPTRRIETFRLATWVATDARRSP